MIEYADLYRAECHQTDVLKARLVQAEIQIAALTAEIAAMQPVVDAAVNYGLSPSQCHRSEARLVEAAGLYRANRVIDDKEPTR